MAIDNVSMLPALTGDCAVTNNAAVVPNTNINAGGNANTNSASSNSNPRGGASSPSAPQGIDSGVTKMFVPSWCMGLLGVAGVMCLL
jgi:hypothetical protein